MLDQLVSMTVVLVERSKRRGRQLHGAEGISPMMSLASNDGHCGGIVGRTTSIMSEMGEQFSKIANRLVATMQRLFTFPILHNLHVSIYTPACSTAPVQSRDKPLLAIAGRLIQSFGPGLSQP